MLFYQTTSPNQAQPQEAEVGETAREPAIRQMNETDELLPGS